VERRLSSLRVQRAFQSTVEMGDWKVTRTSRLESLLYSRVHWKRKSHANYTSIEHAGETPALLS
jgi:hypothetical protein